MTRIKTPNWKNFRRWLGNRILVTWALMCVISVALDHKRSCLPGFPITGHVQGLLGTDIRDREPVVRDILCALSRERGILLLGTSETNNDLDGANLQHWLHAEHKVPVIALGGAGRSAYIWIPFLLEYGNVLGNARAILYVNPTYWRDDLNRYDPTYTRRYIGESRWSLAGLRRSGLPDGIFPEDALAPQDGWTGSLRRLVVPYGLASYYRYLKTWQTLRKQPVVPTPARPEHIEETVARVYTNPQGVPDPFLARFPNWQLPLVDPSPEGYQWRALDAMLDLAAALGIHPEVVLGPYNGVALEALGPPEKLDAHRRLAAAVVNHLEPRRLRLTDASEVSYIPGSMLDAQHHSAWGAWHIAQIMRQTAEDSP